ncbi:MAG: hypothetical protein CMH83_03345 [Nocardioides sp.]|nr:hypothetical protein [Nocardioides sp.]
MTTPESAPSVLPARVVPVLLALPALALGAAGLLHPDHLTYDTSYRWFALHVPGVLVFPLVAAAPWWLVRGRRDVVAWVVRLTAYGYATFYTALDVISGVGAGWVTHELGPGVPRPEAVSRMFTIGTPLGKVGSWSLLVCVVVLAIDQVVRRGVRAWPVLLVVVGAALVHWFHIFAPWGVLGMALLGVGSGLAASGFVRDVSGPVKFVADDVQPRRR